MIHRFTESWGEITKRVVIGGALAGIALFCTLFNPFTFYMLVVVVALLMHIEWLELTKDSRTFSRVGGLFYIGLPIASLIMLRGPAGPEYVLVLFAMVWATDIAAYVAGSRFGTHKIAPRLSPGKSWEGLAGGMLGAGIVGAAAGIWASFPTDPLEGFLIGLILAVISQAGDLFESWIKRRAGVKDSGTLLPGHGGMLDRVDGLVFAAPAFALMVMLLGNAA